MIGSLVAYKGKYSQILSSTNNKFEIIIEGDKKIKVREKDFRFLSPDFQIPTPSLDVDFSAVIELEEQLLPISELSEWLFGGYNANSAWHTFLLVENGLHFFWQKDKIFIRPASQVTSIKQKRQIEVEQKISLQHCVDNIRLNKFIEKDREILQEIEKVALNQLKSAKILKLLKIPNTPQEAHKLLTKINYLDLFFNPYPARFKILNNDKLAIDTKNDNSTNRVNLTHLLSYAIDNEGSNDADDAISIDTNKIWIHIADVASIVNADLLEYASNRVSNLYLPDKIIGMLPDAVNKFCSLGGLEKSRALSIGFELDDNKINNITIVNSIIKVTKISYENADLLLDKTLSKFKNIADKHKKFRQESGSFSLDLPKVDIKVKDMEVLLKAQDNTPARLMVAEFMILAGRVIAQFSIENNIPMPFVSQEKGNFDQQILNKEKLSLSESFSSIRNFKRSITSNIPKLHFGLGLDSYIRVTSPMRRYLDLISQCQIHNFINKKPIFTIAEINKIITNNNSLIGNVNKAAKYSNNHYKLLFLIKNKQVFDATIISNTSNKSQILISDLAMIETIKYSGKVDDIIKIQFSEIDIFNQKVTIKIVNS